MGHISFWIMELAALEEGVSSKTIENVYKIMKTIVKDSMSSRTLLGSVTGFARRC
jgi:hypothetical protein